MSPSFSWSQTSLQTQHQHACANAPQGKTTRLEPRNWGACNHLLAGLCSLIHLGNHIRSYINRKLFPSLVLQGICDSKGTFLDVYIGNCGSVHDALVLRRSPIYKQAIYPPAGFFLLGDGGYPCLKHPVAILSLYRQPVSSKNIIPFSLHLQTQSSATSVTVKHAEL